MQIENLNVQNGSAPNPMVQTLGGIIGNVRDDVFSGVPPVSYPMSDGPVGSLQLRPGEMFVIAGAPGYGKTGLATQWATDAVRNTPGIKLLIANVEMSPAMIIRRQLARLSGTFLGRILQNEAGLMDDQGIQRAFATLDDLSDRIAFVQGSFSLDHIRAAVDQYEPQIVLVDYIQRIDTGHAQNDQRMRLNAVMQGIREIASGGVCVVAVSAVARTGSKKDGGYDGRSMGLGSFRESSEVEYGADEAVILVPDNEAGDEGGFGSSASEEPWPRPILLKHVKSRNGELRDVPMFFDGRVQRFWVRQQNAAPGTTFSNVRNDSPPSGRDLPTADMFASEL